MSLQEQIMQLLILLKKSNNKDDKKLIKNKLKSLYNKLNTRAKKPKKMVKFNLPYKEEIKEVLNPLRQQFLNLSQELKQRKNDLANQIIKKEQKIKKIKDEDEKEREKEKLEKLKDEKEIIDSGIRNKQKPEQIIEEVNFALNASFPKYASWLYTRFDEDTVKEKLFNRYLKDNRISRKEIEKDEAELKKIEDEINKLVEKTGLEYLQALEEKKAREELARQEAEFRKLEKQRLQEEKRQQEQARKEREAEERRARREAEDIFGSLASALGDPTMPKKKGSASALPPEEEEEEEDLSNFVSKKVLKILKDFNDLDTNFQLQQNPAEYNKIMEKFIKDKAEKLTSQDTEDLRKLIWQKQHPISKIASEFISRATDELFNEKSAKTEEVKKAIRDARDIFSYKLTIDPATEAQMGQAEPEAKGQGKRKRKINYNSIMDKIHGGAGIADWMLTLGSIPGVPQLMNNMGPFGQVLGNMSGLAQTFGKTAGQLIKEQSKSGEKVAGFTDALGGPLKAMVGGKKSRAKKYGRGLNMADVSGGAFLSDFLGTLGGITPKISGLVGAVPTYGKVATIGNSVLGSASRVGEDIAKMLGLGNMDLLGKTKGYGRKKGGRKMLPYGRPMPTRHGYYTRPIDDMAMATIQPYGMPYGGFGLTDALFDATGDLIKGVAKGAATGLKNIGKDLAKTGIQKLADSAVQSIGKGRRKKVKGRGKPKMSGCGKINGKYVSSEYESNYEDALSRNRLFNEMARMNAEQQMEQAILNQQNMEQQTALSQLEYHNLLRTIQQQNQ